MSLCPCWMHGVAEKVNQSAATCSRRKEEAKGGAVMEASCRWFVLSTFPAGAELVLMTLAASVASPVALA